MRPFYYLGIVVAGMALLSAFVSFQQGAINSIILVLMAIALTGIGFIGTYATRILIKINQSKFIVLEKHGF